MIVDRSLTREVTYTSLAVTLVIVAIFIVVRLVRFLSDAAAGDIPVDSIFVLLGLKVASNLDVMLPMVFYIAILMVMSRWSRDHELVVLAACGIGLARLLRPVGLMALFLAAVMAAFSFYITPLAVRESDIVTAENKNRVDIKGVVPGTFAETRGKDVYYVERVANDKQLLVNVFVYGRKPDNEGVVVARDGYQYVDELTGDRFLVLRQGTRYEGNPGEADYRVMEFETYALRIKTKSHIKPAISLKGTPTAKLLNSTEERYISELHWRIAKPVSVLILALLAMSFTSLSVRKSQFPQMIMAFAAYFMYANVLGYANAMLQKGKLSPELGLWWVHALFLALGAYMFVRRSRNRPLFHFSLRSRAAART